MMAFTTLFIAVPIVIIIYLLIIKKVKKPIISYLVVLIVGVLFMFGRVLHLIYVGLEIIIIGFIVIWIKNTFNSKRKAKTN